MISLHTFSIWLHIVSACIWFGGMFFLVVVVIPSLQSEQYRKLIAPLLHDTGIRFRAVGWTAFAVFIVTGFYNLGVRGITMSHFGSIEFWASPFGSNFGIKMGLFVILVVLSFFHDFILGPKTTRLWLETPQHPDLLQYRKLARHMGRVSFFITLILLFLGVTLSRGGF